MAAVKITRIIDAPIERVWAAWSDPELMKQWWGPKDFTAPHVSMDFREGGKYLYAMHGPAGSEFDKDMWSTGTYEEIVPMKRIVCTDSFADAEGNVVSPADYGMAELSQEMRITIELEALDGGKTRLALTHEGAPESGPQRSGMEDGWNESLDKLAASL